MVIDSTFYVYLYSTPEGEPFYVGKGRGDRYLHYTSLNESSSKHPLKFKILKIGIPNVVVSFLATDLSESDAFFLEREWIAHYGRRDLGTGTLCNMTDGGDGISGYRFSAESKRRVGDRNRSRVWNSDSREKVRNSPTRHTFEVGNSFSRGRVLTKEHKERIKESMRLVASTRSRDERMRFAREELVCR